MKNTKDREGAQDWAKAGDEFLMKDRYQDAFQCYEKALELDPLNSEYLLSKSRTLLNLNRQQEALQIFDKALSFGLDDKTRISVIAHKGLAFSVLQKHEEAFKCYNEVLAIDPAHIETLIYKGRALGDLGQLEEAIRCLDKVINYRPTLLSKYAVQHMDLEHEAWGSKGNVLSHMKKFDEALYCYDQAIKTTPKYNPIALAEWWSRKGEIQFQLAKFPEALECYEKFTVYHPRLIINWIHKINMLAGMEKYDEAINTYMEARTFDPDKFDSEYEACTTKFLSATIFMEKNGTMVVKKWLNNLKQFIQEKRLIDLGAGKQKVVEDFTRVKRQKEFFINEAQKYMNSGDVQKAIESCEEGLKLDKEHKELWNLLVQLYQKSKLKKICGVCRSYTSGQCTAKKEPTKFLNLKAAECFQFLRNPLFIEQ